MPRYGLITDDYESVDEDSYTKMQTKEASAEAPETSGHEYDLLEAQSRSTALVQKCGYPFKVMNTRREDDANSIMHGTPLTSIRLRPIKLERQECADGEDVSIYESEANAKIKRLKLESWQCDNDEQHFDANSEGSFSIMFGTHSQPFFKRELRWDLQQPQPASSKPAPTGVRLVERKPRVLLSELTPDIFNDKTLEVSPRAASSVAFPACRVSFGPHFRMYSQSAHCRYGVIECSTLTLVPLIEHFFLAYLERHGRLGELDRLLDTELLRLNPPSPMLTMLDSWLLSVKDAERLGGDAVRGVSSDNSINRAIEELCGTILLPLDAPNRGVRQRILFGRWLAEYLGEESERLNQNTRRDSPFAHIFDCLVNGQLERATDLAKRNGLYNLSLLISLFKMARRGKYEMADEHYTKILQLMAGDWKPGEKSSKTEGQHRASCLQGLNYVQVLGVICWYWAPPSNSLDDVVEMFGQIEKVISPTHQNH